MTTEELTVALRLAELEGFIGDMDNHASCNSYGCDLCPADKACRYLSDLNGSPSFKTFIHNFDLLVRPSLQKYSIEYVQNHYPEHFI